MTEDDEYLLEEFLQGDGELEAAELNRLVAIFDLDVERVNFDNGPVWTLQHGDDLYVLERDENSALYEAAEATSWLENVLFFSVRDVDDYVTYDDELGNFWAPGTDKLPPLYHATDEENVEDILRDGLEARDKTRGMGNRWTGVAVFTSFNRDAIDVYGDAVFKIDTTQMRNDGYHPELAIEPSIREYETMIAIRHAIGLDDDDVIIDMPDSSAGYDYDTVIIFGHIPAKYLRLL